MVVERMGKGYKRRYGVLAPTYHQYLLEVRNISQNLLVPPFEHLFDPQIVSSYPNLPFLHLSSQLSHHGPPLPKAIMP